MVPVHNLLLTTLTVLGLVSADMMYPQGGGAFSSWPFLQFLFHMDRNISGSKNFEMNGFPLPLTMGHVYLLGVVSMGSIYLFSSHYC